MILPGIREAGGKLKDPFMGEYSEKCSMEQPVSFWEPALSYAREHYGIEGDHPFRLDNVSTVLRHGDNRKWFGLFMRVEREKLGLPGEGEAELLNVKCDPLLAGSLLQEAGFLPGYHMNHVEWLTILLDGTVPFGQICSLLDMSYGLTASKKTLEKDRKPRAWLVPANPKYFDVIKAFRENEVINWKQSSDVRVGDPVYLYVAAPWSAILYRCVAEEVKIPYTNPEHRLNIRFLMKIRRLQVYEPHVFSREVLAGYGVTNVRGPRGVPPALLEALDPAASMEEREAQP